MTRSGWKDLFQGVLDGIEGELRSTAPTKARVVLNAFRRRLDEGRTMRRRKEFEQELEAFLYCQPFLRAATKRYLRMTIISTVEAATSAARSVVVCLEKNRTTRRA